MTFVKCVHLPGKAFADRWVTTLRKNSVAVEGWFVRISLAFLNSGCWQAQERVLIPHLCSSVFLTAEVISPVFFAGMGRITVFLWTTLLSKLWGLDGEWHSTVWSGFPCMHKTVVCNSPELPKSSWGVLNSAVRNVLWVSLLPFLGNKEATSGNCLSLQDASSLCCAGMVPHCQWGSADIFMKGVSSAAQVRTLHVLSKTSYPKGMTDEFSTASCWKLF